MASPVRHRSRYPDRPSQPYPRTRRTSRSTRHRALLSTGRFGDHLGSGDLRGNSGFSGSCGRRTHSGQRILARTIKTGRELASCPRLGGTAHASLVHRGSCRIQRRAWRRSVSRMATQPIASRRSMTLCVVDFSTSTFTANQDSSWRGWTVGDEKPGVIAVASSIRFAGQLYSSKVYLRAAKTPSTRRSN